MRRSGTVMVLPWLEVGVRGSKSLSIYIMILFRLPENTPNCESPMHVIAVAERATN